MYARILRKWSLTKFLMYLWLLPIIMLLITCCQNVTSLHINASPPPAVSSFPNYSLNLTSAAENYVNALRYHPASDRKPMVEGTRTTTTTTTTTLLSIPSSTATRRTRKSTSATTKASHLALNLSSRSGNVVAEANHLGPSSDDTFEQQHYNNTSTKFNHNNTNNLNDDDKVNDKININNSNSKQIINYVPNVPISNSQINNNLDNIYINNTTHNKNNGFHNEKFFNNIINNNNNKLNSSANLGLNKLSNNNIDQNSINIINNSSNKQMISIQNIFNKTFHIRNRNININNNYNNNYNTNNNDTVNRNQILNFSLNKESVNQNTLQHQPNNNDMHSRNNTIKLNTLTHNTNNNIINNNKTLKQDVETRRIRNPPQIDRLITNYYHNDSINNRLRRKPDPLALLEHEIYYYKNDKHHAQEQMEKQARTAAHRRSLFDVFRTSSYDRTHSNDNNNYNRNRRDSHSSSFPLHLTQIPSTSTSGSRSINIHQEYYQQGQQSNFGNGGSRMQTSSSSTATSSIAMLGLPTTSYSTNMYSQQYQLPPQPSASSSSATSSQLSHLSPVPPSIYFGHNLRYQNYDNQQYFQQQMQQHQQSQQQQQPQQQEHDNRNQNYNVEQDIYNFNNNERNQYFYQQQQYFRNTYKNNYHDHHQRNKRQKRYCSARDPAQLAFEAPTVFEGKIISMSSDRRQNFSVTFEVKQIFKKQIGKLLLPELVRLDFTYRNSSGECDIYREFLRPRGLISKDKDKELELGRTYLLFVQQIDIRNFTILGQPILKTKRKIEAVRKGVSQTNEQRASIISLAATANGIKIERERRVEDGQKLRIICRVSGQPPPKVTWFKDSKSIRNRKLYQFVHLKKRSELIVKSFKSSDAGEYECRAKNKKIQKPEKKSIKIEAYRSNSESIAQRSGDECAVGMKQYCLHGGTCKYFKEINIFSCICPDGFYGDRCQEKQWNETPIPTSFNAGYLADDPRMFGALTLANEQSKSLNANEKSMGKKNNA